MNQLSNQKLLAVAKSKSDLRRKAEKALNLST